MAQPWLLQFNQNQFIVSVISKNSKTHYMFQPLAKF
jgi:hypothetical protein